MIDMTSVLRRAGIFTFSVLWFAAGLFAAPLDGVWEITITRFGEPSYSRATIQTTGDKLAGQFDAMALEGTAHGEAVAFSVRQNDGTVIGDFKGSTIEGVLVGTAKLHDDVVSWTAQHLAERPVGAPKTHRFFPRSFQREFSGGIAPVMHVYPGDSVTTSTIDAEGMVSSGRQRSPGPNPLTGPFYVETAWPGDTLAVHFTRIRMNRDSAHHSHAVVGSAWNPDYFKDLKPEDKFDSEWRLDREHGVAALKNPSEKLKNFSIKLAPMLGCVGVAPPGRSAIESTYPGSFGGNMDYNQIREDVTVYFPVYQPGALLYIGDGHAAQGDAELTGDALETSMDVEFTVDVRQGQSIDMPRAENAEYVMALGIGNSLEDALQAATTNMARWLERDYKLNSAEVAMVLGTTVHYDIAEIVDPRVNLVAKVPKSVLSQLRQ
jgi:amidase